MAITWGAGSGSGYGIFYVGIDYSVSGTTATVRYYVRTEANAVSDTQTLTYSGKITGSTNFTMNTPNMGAQLVSTKTFSGTRGQSYSVTAKLSGTYSGGTPQHTRSITIPAAVPGKPGTPSVSSITSSTATATWSAAATNGASIAEYQLQLDDNSGFSSPSTVSTGTSRSRNLSGMSANDTWYVRVRARNSAGWGAWSSTRSFQTKPLAPSTPGAPSVSRNSDTSHAISWSRSASASQPITDQRVQRRTSSTGGGGSGDWATIATIGTDYTSNGTNSYTDTTTIANRAYQYRIQAVNSAGTTTGSGTGWVFTTPATPTAASATKNSAGNIAVTWTIGALYSDETQHQIQESTDDGSSWSALATVSGSTSTYTHTSPNVAVTHTYRVRTVINASGSVGNGLASGYRNTNTVQLAAPPNAPTVTAPTGTFDATQPITVTWIHNPVDSSDQTRFNIAYKYTEDVDWEYLDPTLAGIVSDDSTYTFPEDSWENGRSVDIRVRTWGTHSNASPWSATATFTTSSAPIATIVTPDGVSDWPDPRITVEWAFFDAEDDPQASWQIQLVDLEDNVVETKNGSGTSTSDILNTIVSDGSTWTVRLRLRDGAGMWSDWVEVPILVNYPEPPKPLITGEWQPEDGTVQVTVTNPDPLEEITYVWNGTELESTSTQYVGATPTRTNLATDPQATEVGTINSGWFSVGNVNRTVVTPTPDAPVPYINSYVRTEVTESDPLMNTSISVSQTGLTGTSDDHVAAGFWLRSSVDLVGTASLATTIPEDVVQTTISTMANEWVWVPLGLETSTTYNSMIFQVTFTEADNGPMEGVIIDGTGALMEQNQENLLPYFDGETPGEPAQTDAVSVSIYRRVQPSTEWVLLAENVEPNSIIDDKIPTINGVNEYRAIAFSETGASNESDVYELETAEPYWHYINFGPDFGTLLKFWANPEVTASVSREKQLYHFANATGKAYPVELASESVTRRVEISAEISEASIYGEALASSTTEEFEDFGQVSGVVVYRDPLGRRMFSSVDGFTWSRTVFSKGSPKKFSMLFSEVEYEE